MTRRQNRMLAVGGLIAGLAVAAWLGFTAMSKNLMYFYTPTDVVSGKAPAHAKMRLGGLVERGSVARVAGLLVSFALADCAQKVGVKYEGILPDLFREGQGIVAQGTFQPDRSFRADQVLAKHDETYMPREVADRLKERGEWRPEGAQP